MGYDGGEHGRVIVDDVIQETKNVEMTHRKCHKGLPWQKATPSFCGTFQVQVLGFRRVLPKRHKKLKSSSFMYFSFKMVSLSGKKTCRPLEKGRVC